jgi:tetratricopeptide (TPR) repeat protein
MPGDKPDFFVSYASEDRPWAEWIAWQLEGAGYSTVLQAWDFMPGSDFIHEMQKATATAVRTIAVLSPAYFVSQFAESEWRVAFAMDPTGEKGLLVPVRVQKVQPPGLLSTRVYLDLVELDETAAKERLLGLLHNRGARPSTSPRFPGAGPGSIAETPVFPGDLPGVWNVPYPRHPSFVGRKDLLARLDQEFSPTTSGTPAIPRRVVLVGLAGVGKTQLAVEYVHRHRDDYALIWWVRAETAATLIGDFAALGSQVGLKDYPDQDATNAAVQVWLEQSQRRWLLVFDGADAQFDVLAFLLPKRGPGHVLLTSSRGLGWDDLATPVPVDVLSVEEGAQLLMTRTGEKDEVTAAALATALGCVPLALEQTSALIAQSAILGLNGYLEQLQQRSGGAELLARVGVGTAWDLSLTLLQEESPGAVDLLELAAFLAADDLPWHQLVDHAELLPARLAVAARNAIALDEAVNALRRYSLAKVAGKDRLSVNRLLQTVIEQRLTPPERRGWVKVAVRLLDASFPDVPEQRSAWPACQQLLPHALRVIEHAEQLGVELDLNAELLSRAIEYLRVRGQPTPAREVVEQALAARPPGPGPEPAARAVIYRSFGRVLRDLGDLKGARNQLERALQIDKTVFGPKDQRVADDRRFLGQILREQGNLDEARRAQLQWALVIDEEVHGLRDRRVADDRRELGLVFHNLGNLSGARAQLVRALVIDEDTFGPKHPRTADDRRQLGLVYRDIGEFQAAKTELMRALAIDEELYGPDHWRVAEDRRCLATILRDLGDLNDAREELVRALAIDQTVYVPEDWRSAQDRRYLATVLCRLGRFAEAQAELERALAIDESTFGPDHWRVAQDRRHLGRALCGLRELPRARDELERALTIDEELYGPGDWRVAEDRRYLGNVLYDLGELAKARDELERALAIDESTFGPDHWRVGEDWRHLAVVLRDLGELRAESPNQPPGH